MMQINLTNRNQFKISKGNGMNVRKNIHTHKTENENEKKDKVAPKRRQTN